MGIEIRKLVWKNILLLLILHLFALHGLYYLLTFQCTFSTFLWGFFVGFISAQGITSGAHRLWSHRSYKARLPLQLLLCFFQTMALQTPIYDWVRDHRVHHKCIGTDGDPHNASRGFFFSHVGWLLVPKHPEVTIQGKKLDLSDLENNPIVMFQKRYYLIFAPVLCLVLPALVPWYYTHENLYISWTTVCVFRYVLMLHATWSVNSVAHIWGTKPYDSTVKATENLGVAICALGEGWHNFHHVFPWDYKTGELGNYGTNMSKAFIDVMVKIGWAYGRRTVTPEVLEKRRRRTGLVAEKVF